MRLFDKTIRKIESFEKLSPDEYKKLNDKEKEQYKSDLFASLLYKDSKERNNKAKKGIIDLFNYILYYVVRK